MKEFLKEVIWVIIILSIITTLIIGTRVGLDNSCEKDPITCRASGAEIKCMDNCEKLNLEYLKYEESWLGLGDNSCYCIKDDSPYKLY